MARSAEEVLELNQILQEINIPDRDVSVKGATSKQVTYVVKSNDRDGTKSAVESLISRLGRVYNEQRSISSIPVSCVRMSDGTILTFIYKPKTGGMSMTTLNSSITELFPCIAFMNGINPNLSVRDFYQAVRNANSSSGGYYLTAQDALAGKKFIDQAEAGSFQTKVTNAKNKKACSQSSSLPAPAVPYTSTNVHHSTNVHPPLRKQGQFFLLFPILFKN